MKLFFIGIISALFAAAAAIYMTVKMRNNRAFLHRIVKLYILIFLLFISCIVMYFIYLDNGEYTPAQFQDGKFLQQKQ